MQDSQITGKKIQEISNNIAKVENSEDLIKQINLLLEQSIPLQNLSNWVGIWAALYKNLETSIQNRLQARFLLWLQIMLYSEQSPQQKLSSNTIETLQRIARDSILGSSINKCLMSTSPASLHR